MRTKNPSKRGKRSKKQNPHQRYVQHYFFVCLSSLNSCCFVDTRGHCLKSKICVCGIWLFCNNGRVWNIYSVLMCFLFLSLVLVVFCNFIGGNFKKKLKNCQSYIFCIVHISICNKAGYACVILLTASARQQTLFKKKWIFCLSFSDSNSSLHLESLVCQLRVFSLMS